MQTDALSLEDFYEDIIGKAQRGLHLSNTELASRAGLDEAQVSAALRGEFDQDIARALAKPLRLGADALVACGKKAWYPQGDTEVTGLAMANTTYLDMRVNAYLVWNAETRAGVAFDTGTDCGLLLDTAREHSLKISHILLTHTHTDHVEDLTRLKRETGAEVFVAHEEAVGKAKAIADGKVFELEGLRIEARLTPGHSPGGMTFVVEGLAKPVAIVGDALFAGSMGGAPNAWQDALAVNREKILSLPDETVLCPGHGPKTTVADEKANNPFYTA